MVNKNRKIQQAIELLKLLGMPEQQLNVRTALCLLALSNIKPNDHWCDVQRPSLGIKVIMDWCRDNYGANYAENTRESFRRQSIHQFIEAGICIKNPDNPYRSINSPHNVYQLDSEVYKLLSTFGTNLFNAELQNYLLIKQTLIEKYAKERDMVKIPLILPNNHKLILSPGMHSELIKNIITEFGPIFSPAGIPIYVGDTGNKYSIFDINIFNSLGIYLDYHGKLPDVVIYDRNRNWLLLIEAVTTHGPIDPKRYNELRDLFKNSMAGLVFISAFPDKKTYLSFANNLAWETEIWIADAPTHMIHLNGSRFLGPYI